MRAGGHRHEQRHVMVRSVPGRRKACCGSSVRDAHVCVCVGVGGNQGQAAPSGDLTLLLNRPLWAAGFSSPDRTVQLKNLPRRWPDYALETPDASPWTSILESVE